MNVNHTRTETEISEADDSEKVSTPIGDTSDFEKVKEKAFDYKAGISDTKMSEADCDSEKVSTLIGDNSDVEQEKEKAFDGEARITDTKTDESEITFQINILKQAGISDNIDECKKTCTEISNDSVAKEPSNAFIENAICKPVCDNSEFPECLEHMTEINNNHDPDRKESSTVIISDEVNTTEVTNETRNENIEEPDEEKKVMI